MTEIKWNKKCIEEYCSAVQEINFVLISAFFLLPEVEVLLLY